MLAITKTAALRGIEGINVTVEVDSSRGLPAFLVVGLGDAFEFNQMPVVHIRLSLE